MLFRSLRDGHETGRTPRIRRTVIAGEGPSVRTGRPKIKKPCVTRPFAHVKRASEVWLGGFSRAPHPLSQLRRQIADGADGHIGRLALGIKALGNCIDKRRTNHHAICHRANGGGIALMPTYVHDLQKNLVPLNLPEVAPIRFWLTYPERVRRLARAQIVIDWLRGLFNQRLTPWFKPNFVHPQSMDKASATSTETKLTTPPVA